MPACVRHGVGTRYNLTYLLSLCCFVWGLTRVKRSRIIYQIYMIPMMIREVAALVGGRPDRRGQFKPWDEPVCSQGQLRADQECIRHRWDHGLCPPSPSPHIVVASVRSARVVTEVPHVAHLAKTFPLLLNSWNLELFIVTIWRWSGWGLPVPGRGPPVSRGMPSINWSRRPQGRNTAHLEHALWGRSASNSYSVGAMESCNYIPQIW